MKPQPAYYAFVEQHKEEQQKLIDIIKDFGAIEKIFLLGLPMNQQRTESLFNMQSATGYSISHFYILVLAHKEDEHSLNCLQDKIENNLQHFIPTTAIVINFQTFNNWLSEGHPFVVNVVHQAVGLFDSGNNNFNEPAELNEEKVIQANEKKYKQTVIKVQEFMAGAELFTLRIKYNLAAFMLHQAAEHLLCAMLKINTGLRVNTHSIDKLIRYCTMFSYLIPDTFQKTIIKTGGQW